MTTQKCAFHPTETLTNFCRNPSCLLPMCPSCIKVHSLQHMRQNTHGLYDSLADIHLQVQTTLEQTLRQLIGSGEHLQQVYRQKQDEKAGIMARLREARARVLETVSRYIDEVEGSIVESIESVQARIEQRISQADLKIEKLSGEAEGEVEALNGQKQMKAIISHVSTNMPTYYGLKIKEIEGIISQVSNLHLNYERNLRAPELNEALRLIGECYRLTFSQPLKNKATGRQTSQQFQVSGISKSSSTQCSAKKIV